MLALAGPLGPQARVQADQQALAGEVRADDLGHLVGHQLAGPQGGLEGARVLPGSGPGPLQQRAQVLGAQCRDPVQPGRLEVLADARRGEHAAVAHQGDAGDAEALADAPHPGADRGRVGGVAGERLDGQRAAVGGAQHPEDDLRLALLAVAAVAVGGQRAEPPFEVAGADVVEDQGGVAEVADGEAGLDPTLSSEQPVEEGEHFAAGDGAEAEQGAEAGVGGVGREPAGGGELGVGSEDAGDDGGEGEGALAAGLAVEGALEAELAAGAEDGGDVAVGPGAFDVEEVGGVVAGDAALEDGAEGVADMGRELGEVAEGLLADALALAPSLAEEDGGFAGLVGDRFDVEGHGERLWVQQKQFSSD